MRKNLSIKVYSPQNNFLKEWTNAKFQGFTKQINGGLGECVLTLPEKFDYSGAELAENNSVIITIADKDTKNVEMNGLVIYSGYISFYEPDASGKNESITVHLLGHYTKLAMDILKHGAQTTLYSCAIGLQTAAGSSDGDAGIIMNAILARYAAETADHKLTALSIPVVGQNLNYVFAQMTYREALDIAISACPDNYFYYINAYGGFVLKTQDSQPRHEFVRGKNMSKIHVGRSMENIRNVVLFWNGASVYREYSDLDSVGKYGRRVQRITDKNVQNEISADNIAAKYLAEHKDPDIIITCTIPDNNLYMTEGLLKGYDIESIEPGDTCRFVGFDDENAYVFRDNMVVTQVQYSLYSAVITIQNLKTDLVYQAKSAQSQINQINANGVPDSYT